MTTIDDVYMTVAKTLGHQLIANKGRPDGVTAVAACIMHVALSLHIEDTSFNAETFINACVDASYKKG